MYYSYYNGKLVGADELLIHPNNRSFRYGEGLFETMRLQQGQIPLWEKHWKRLSESLPQLYFSLPVHFSAQRLKEEVLQLAQKNQCTDAARIRITVFKGEGGLWEPPSSPFNYIIQCWPLEKKEFLMNENGLDIGVFEAGKKSCDAFSHLKSNNYQLYTLAAQYAKQQQWNECIVLNQYGRICDATIANIFFVKNRIIHTPHMSEGCVQGIMRQHIIEASTKAGLAIEEGAYEIADTEQADEIFFTNAMYGIRWAKLFGSNSYSFSTSAKLFQQFILPLFS